MGSGHDGVPVLHVQPVPARLRQLRVVVQELKQDDDQGRRTTPGAPACREEGPKSCAWAKSRLTRKKKRRELFNTGIFLAKEFFYYSFKSI